MGKVPLPQSSPTWWMSEWQMPEYLMSITMSCSPTARVVTVVFASGAFGLGAA